MRCKHWLVVTGMLLAVIVGCRDRNPYYCQEHRDDPDCADEGDKCGEVQCQAPAPVCKMDTLTCVECVGNGDCPSSRSTCTAQNTCVQCENDGDCSSEVCLIDGECAADDAVAYVSGAAAGNNAECSRAMPCKTLAQALSLSPPRQYIKATGMLTEAAVTTIDRRTVSIYGEPGMTTIMRTGGGGEPVFDIRHEAVVTFSDLEIVAAADGHGVEIRDIPGPSVTMVRVKVREAKDNGIQVTAGKLTLTESQVTNSTLAGINLTMSGSLVMTGSQVFKNTAEGVKAAAGTQVDIRRSSITENRGTAGVFATDATMVVIESSIIAANTGTSGGVSIRGPLVMRNNIIASNGIPATTAIGGVALDSANAQFEFNTVADNVGAQGGVYCASLMDMSNSIFTGSTFYGVNCLVTYSLTATSGSPVGMGSKTGEPVFLSKSLSSSMFYRIDSTSAAKDSADPSATLAVDIDGQPRTGRRDMGADEAN